MTRLVWDDPNEIVITSGVDHCVIFPQNTPPVAWNGIVSILEHGEDAVSKFSYYDGYKYISNIAVENFSASVEAVTYPEELDDAPIIDLSYRTWHQDVYDLHILYNVRLYCEDVDHFTTQDGSSLTNFKWTLTAIPEKLDFARATAHVIINSENTTSEILTTIEDILYGSEGAYMPRIAKLPELIQIYEELSIFKIIDNGDGSWTASGPDDMIEMIDSTSFKITSPSIFYLSADSYKIRSW